MEQGQGVAYPVGGSGRELRRVKQGVDGDDFLQERSHDACAEGANTKVRSVSFAKCEGGKTRRTHQRSARG